MSTEIDELEKRIASLEKEFRAVFGKAETIKPAPGSDAEHPPVGYVLVPRGSGEVIAADWIVWSFDRGPWRPLSPNSVGDRAHSGFHPLARPIPANGGDSRLAESVAIPVGWVFGFPEGANFRYWRKDETGGGFWGTTARTCVTVRLLMIVPDPSIPWGEGYEAILPSEADIICDEYKPYPGCKSWEKWMSIKGQARDEFAWRRRIPATTPTESARDLSAEVERLEAELRAMTERAENFGRALRSIAEYKGLYIDSEAFYATRKIARVAIANEGEKA